MNLEQKGYPYNKSNACLLWHERKTTNQTCSNQTTRAQDHDHLAQHLPKKEPQFGIYNKITRYQINITDLVVQTQNAKN